jgi:RsiW-degrading membrane proteinase PrsW (M82 family)
MTNNDSIDMEIAEFGDRKISLLKIIWNVFISPSKGTGKLFNGDYSNRFVFAVILNLVSCLVAVGIAFLLLREMSSDKYDSLVRLGLALLMFNLLVSLFCFLANAIARKADISKALLTGGLSGLVYAVGLILLFIISLASGKDPFNELVYGGLSGGLSWLFLFIVLYILLLIFNVVKQSLLSGNEKDGASFYLSPIIVVFSFYLAIYIARNLPIS